MLTQTNKTTSEAEIRALIDNRVEAVHAKDVEKLLADHAPDIHLFDALAPLQYSGIDEVRKRTEEWLGWYDGPVGYEVRDVDITAGDEVAFCHYLYHVKGTMTNGTHVDMWVRSTLCYSKAGGTWWLTHEHTSVPFDAESGEASTDLEP